MSGAVYKAKIGGIRHLGQVTAKIRMPPIKAGIDHLN
jgi:hypothetical protein